MAEGAGFAGKLAVVTGAASGIGRHSAELLLTRGARVIGVDRERTPALEELARTGARVQTCDVTNSRQRAALMEVSEGADYLVNCAGVVHLPPIAEAREQDWDAIVDVNAKAVFFLCQQLGGRLNRRGAIVNVSSVAARNAVNTETAIYAASKAAILSITRSFAHAYASSDVRVNAIVPGIIDTPMQDLVIDRIAQVRGTDADVIRAGRVAGIPIGRVGSSRECAEAIAWLLSPASSYLTGQAIAVDGGQTML